MLNVSNSTASRSEWLSFAPEFQAGSPSNITRKTSTPLR